MKLTTPSRIDRIITLVVLAVLVGGVYLVLHPFLSAIVWAGDPRGDDLAVVPLDVAPERTSRRSGHADDAADPHGRGRTVRHRRRNARRERRTDVRVVRGVIERGPPDPPAWLLQLPFVGGNASAYWARFAHDGVGLLEEMKRFLEPLRQFAFRAGVIVGDGLLQLTLSVLIAFFFFRDGEAIMARLRGAVSRISPSRGLHMLGVAGATTRAGRLRHPGNALAQGVLMAIGLYIVGIKAAPLLGLVTFFLSPVPVGPPLVWIPVGLWLIFSQGETMWGIFMLLWGTFVVSSVDNVLKPMIISHGSDLPFILVMLGVFGGVIAFGFIGVFLGPVLLALAFALVKEWAAPTDAQPDDI